MSKCRRIKFVFFIMGFTFLSINFAQAVDLRQNEEIVFPDRTSEAIKIDGDLNEKVWSNAPISKEFLTFYPVYGKKMGQKTNIWMVYDSQNLYFGFRSYDTEPNKIKTSICQRDKMYTKDDWIGVIIDSMGNKQTCFEFYVNPSGIQTDFLNSASGGNNMEADFVWESAGKITDEGYQVEICIPLESIRFKSGKEVKMGIFFARHISRLGIVGAWPEVKAGHTGFHAMTTAIYRGLKDRLRLELLPNFTYSRNVERVSDDEWGESDVSKNLGASIKYGITSSITAETTVNPDFSQVESDAFQVEVNRRYPIFYSEKRPFFMEGMDIFDFGILNQGMMIASVHTRCILDPGWAAKLSGVLGKMNFAVLAANDKAPGQIGESGVNPNEGKEAIWSIVRAKYNLGSDNSLGILFSGRYFAGGQNNVAGFDVQYRPFKNARLNAAYLYSRTKESSGDGFTNGNAFNAQFQYVIPSLNVWTTYERYDKGFVMYSAFMNRTAISRGQVYLGPNFYMKIKKAPWFLRMEPHLYYSTLHDLNTGMDDTYWNLGLDMYFTRQGFFKIEYRNDKEAWQGQLFNQDYLYSYGEIRLFKWLGIYGDYRYGDQIYYGPEEPFLGTGHQMRFGFTFQPFIRLNLNFEFVHNELYRKADSQKSYAVDILNLHTTYQFNKYFFIRGVVGYDDFQKKLLTDFLASFTLIPGTVVHVGYGSLYEGRTWLNNQWVPYQDDLLNVKNSLFVKVSYLWRI